MINKAFGWAAIGILLFSACSRENNNDVIYQGKTFTVYNNRVIQGKYKAVAISPDEIISDYQSPANQASPEIEFKFSINSRDNEFPAGINHKLVLDPENGESLSPIFVFGEKDTITDTSLPQRPSLPENTRWTVRVDMNPMLRSFAEKGSYTTPTGDIIYKNDFKGVYIAGSSEPLTWDFENLYGKPEMTLSDTNGDGIYETTLILNPVENNPEKFNNWKRRNDLSAFPGYHSDQLLIDALYNMSIDELIDDIRPDGTLRAGAAWDGVWTRDISYSIYLALAYIHPDAAIKSLRAKVKDNRIIQDTGTGGAWPVSTDRMVWSIAAWEIYKITGNKEWLLYAFEIIRNSAQEDQYTIKDPATGLMRGEQSYLDWREQSYPRWMQPVDIYQSLCLGTNVVHYRTYAILGEMASILGLDAKPYEKQAEILKKVINQNLWMEDKGYYGQYLYGGIYPLLSPGADNLGESLSVLFGVADQHQAARIVAGIPVTEYGATSISPQIPDIKPYHNNAVWPFVQSYWNLASAKAGNKTSVITGLGALYRAAALFTTNKELFVASTGDFKGSAVNSDKMLWSLSGNIAMIYRLYFGMQFEPDGIHFTPFVPSSMPGKKTIDNFKYRNTTLSMSIIGTGNHIEKFSIDGHSSRKHVFPATLTGKHHIDIVLSDNDKKDRSINMQPVEFMPATTLLRLSTDKDSVIIDNFSNENRYTLWIDGKKQGDIQNPIYPLPDISQFTRIAITATNIRNLTGFTGMPITILPENQEIILEAEQYAPIEKSNYQGYSGKGFIEITKTKNVRIDIPIHIPQPGCWYIDVRYSNGSGPINTQNACAIRSLYVNGQLAGPLVMPQRGKDEWSNWGYSNPVTVAFGPDQNRISIRFNPSQNENMNGEINRAFIDAIRLRKAKDSSFIRLFPPAVFPKND